MSAVFGTSPPLSSVRRSFLEFFASKGHQVEPSSSIVPEGDPTLMFVNAGMAPFKDVFTGKAKRAFTRATSSQKCIRISGKHNDLENVGVTARHHTFFEMLGNFSFGDYFKEDAIKYAWELLTKVWQIPQERLIISVFGGENGLAADDEAREIWKRVTGFSEDRIVGLGMKDNFWQMGDTGPCGPCTEIHYFHGEGEPTLATFGDEPLPSGEGWMEIWNLVFMQYERSLDTEGKGVLTPLPKPCVDTGAGLERVASVLQGHRTNYATDTLANLVQYAAELSSKKYGGSQSDDDVSMRVIADHARTTAFLLSEGVFPDRAGREYVLRRVMRRAIRHGHRLGIREPFLHKVALRVVETMGADYPELVRARSVIESVAEQEEVRFRETIDRGLKILDEEVAELKHKGTDLLSGATAFRLYDTFGFPLDLTEVIAAERKVRVDNEGYERALADARVRSEGSKVGDAAVAALWHKLDDSLTTVFRGYEVDVLSSEIIALCTESAVVSELGAGTSGYVVTRETPFYPESGGQIGDTGTITTASGRFVVTHTERPLPRLLVHKGRLESGTLQSGDTVKLAIDSERREATRRNHSATHLLHWALRAVLGPQATQKGSLVGPSRLRFDFAHGKAVTKEELAKIETLVNEKILQNASVVTEVLPLEVARKRGAMAMFGEKYGETVRVLTMTSDSVELCGGTHARALGEIGLFKILSEGGTAAGVRRIEAVTGLASLAEVREYEITLARLGTLLKSPWAEAESRVAKLLASERALQAEVAELRKQVAIGGGGGGGGIDAMIGEARALAEGKALAVQLDGVAVPAQRELADQLRDKLGKAVVLVASKQGDKVQLVLTVSKDLTRTYQAGALIRPVAEAVGGTGGGRPDMAQAGGTNPNAIADAMRVFYTQLGV
jgi:alanyl-tRNA synthetase